MGQVMNGFGCVPVPSRLAAITRAIIGLAVSLHLGSLRRAVAGANSAHQRARNGTDIAAVARTAAVAAHVEAKATEATARSVAAGTLAAATAEARSLRRDAVVG